MSPLLLCALFAPVEDMLDVHTRQQPTQRAVPTDADVILSDLADILRGLGYAQGLSLSTPVELGPNTGLSC
jgi:hypothetical protein